MQIGERIAKLRREAKMTQEHLARRIGVSAPAVSKWESGRSNPDIELLMPIARLFGVSVDELIGFRAELTREEADQLNDKQNRVYSEQGWTAGLLRCEAIASQYPNDAYLKTILASSINGNRVFAKEGESLDAGYQMQERLFSEAMRDADPEIARVAKYLLACLYMTMKRFAEAEELFGEPAEGDFDGKSILPALYVQQGRYEEAEKLAQSNLFDAVGKADNELTILITNALRAGDIQRARKLHNALRSLISVFELTPYREINEVQSWLRIAVAEKDNDGLLNAVERYVELLLAMEYPHSLAENVFFDHSSYENAGMEKERAAALREIVTKDLQNNELYVDIRNDGRFQRAIKKLERP